MVICSILILGGVAAIARFTREPAGVKRLLAAPQLAIGSAGDAMDVRIEGKVELLEGRDFEAPVSGERCVFSDVTVREGGTTLGPILRHTSAGVPFVVRDASGVAVVDPEGAHPELEIDHELRRDWTLLQERLVQAGDTVLIIGRGVLEPNPDPSTVQGHYRDGPATRLRLNNSSQFRLHILDLSRKPR
jgi:hypothetical protein